MNIPEALAIQRKMLEGVQKQFEAETVPGKRIVLERRIRSMYVSMACMALLEGSGIEDRINTARADGAGSH